MAAKLRMYGVNGKDRCFEFDGTTVTFIDGPVDDDRPKFVEAHRDHLFLGYRGGSVINSSLGNPYAFETSEGSVEFAMGDELTGFLSSVSGSLAIFAQNKIGVLRGDDSENWAFDLLTDDAGAMQWSIQNINGPVYFDRAGFRSLTTTDAFGNFSVGTFTEVVEPLIRTKLDAGVTVVASLRCRRKNQYRVFFSDGEGLIIYFGRDPVEVMQFDLGITVTYATSGQDSNGEEILLIGDDSGFVYEMDSGTSFDGSAVNAFIRMPFDHMGSPEVNKRFKKALVHIDGGADASVGVGSDFNYSGQDVAYSAEQTFSIDELTLNGLGGSWGEATFNDFYWSDPGIGQMEVYLDGFGVSCSLIVVTSTTYEDPHIIQSVTYQYETRGLAR